MKSEASELWSTVQPQAPSCANHWMTSDYRSELVSVVIPTFNRAHFLSDCLRSVLDQTYRPIEVILVDNGSTDSTSEVVGRWRAALASDNNFLFTFTKQQNQGANAARNRGLVQARGEYIQFLDSDDLLLPGKLRRAVSAIQRHRADFAYCPVLFRDINLQEIPGRFGEPMSGDDSDITRYLWQTMGPLYRRELVYRVGPWLETVFYGDDWEYSCRVKLLTLNGVFDPEPGGLLRVHPRPERDQPESCLIECREYYRACCSVLKMAQTLD